MAPGGRGECQRLPRKGALRARVASPREAFTGSGGEGRLQDRPVGPARWAAASCRQCQGRGSCLSLLVSKLSWKCGFYVKILDF